jgi:DNA-directed RNA polymerase subunit beta
MTERISFAKVKFPIDVPNLIDIQLSSYREFLQEDVPKTKRKHQGLEAVFREVFPIESPDGRYRLEYLYYTVGKPKYTPLECKRKDITYAVPLRIKVRLRTPKEVREQEVYLCDLPYMTPKGTFIINGDERVVVSQLHRSPGVTFEEISQPFGKVSYTARIVPYYGSWLEFEFDQSKVLHVYIDRRRKFPATTLLRALGYSTDDEIIEQFGGKELVDLTQAGKKRKLIGRIIAEDLKDEETGQVLIEKYEMLTNSHLQRLERLGIKQVWVIKEDIPEIIATIKKDPTKSREEALIDIFRKMQPGNPAILENAEAYFHRLFFDPKRYDLQRVGRFIINRKLGMNVDLDKRTLDKETVVEVIKYLL